MTIPVSIAKAALFTPNRYGWGVPVLFWGLPGVGKTEIMQELSQSCGLHLEVLATSLYEPADFLGLPIIGGDGSVHMTPPRWAKHANDAERACVLLDEATTCPPATQKGFLRTVNERQVGDLPLNPGVRFMLLANPVDIAVGGYDLTPPVANRFCHITCEEVDADKWSSYLVGSGSTTSVVGSAKAEEERVMDKWAYAYAKARGVISAFIRRKPGVLMNMPKKGDKNIGRAWPSPRTWSMAARAYASSQIHGLSEPQADVFCGGCVGTSAWSEFRTFETNVDLPDPAEFLDGGWEKWKMDPRRPDKTYAILDSCVALLTSSETTEDDARLVAFWRFMRQFSGNHADLCVPAVQTLNRCGLAKGDEAVKTIVKMQSIITAANR